MELLGKKDNRRERQSHVAPRNLDEFCHSLLRLLTNSFNEYHISDYNISDTRSQALITVIKAEEGPTLRHLKFWWKRQELIK